MAAASPAFPEVRWRVGVVIFAGLRFTMHPARCWALGSCCHPARGQTNIQWSFLLLSQDPGAGARSYHHPFDHSPCRCFFPDPQFNGEGCPEDNFSATSDLAHRLLPRLGPRCPCSSICFHRKTLGKQAMLF